MAVFFGILIGIFAIGGASANLITIAEGKTAGKHAFEIIDRKPEIELD